MKSFLFNVAFYVVVTCVCLVYLPLLFLPRSLLVAGTYQLMRLIAWLEKTIVGLDYKVEGLEHLPASGGYLVAMKHQSAYETLKLALLFPDPAIILKRELLFIPLWGWYTLKLQMIAINRAKGSKALADMLESAKRVAAQNRPIVIFPQGTRVPVGAGVDAYPYKIGTFKLYQALNLPVVPVALDSGKFWPKNSMVRKAGTVTFRVLPPIPAGLDQPTFMARLQSDIENACNDIVN